MNLFFGIRVEDLYDCHVRKMLLETAQLLCTAVHIRAPVLARSLQKEWLYMAFNPKHPICVWVADTKAHFDYTLEYGLALCNEFTHRFKKQSAVQCQLAHLQKLTCPEWECLSHQKSNKFVSWSTPVGVVGLPQNIQWFPLCMDDMYFNIDVKLAYKRFYYSKIFTMKVQASNSRYEAMYIDLKQAMYDSKQTATQTTSTNRRLTHQWTLVDEPYVSDNPKYKYSVSLLCSTTNRIKIVDFGCIGHWHYRDVTRVNLYFALNHNDDTMRDIYYMYTPREYDPTQSLYWEQRYLNKC